MSRLIALLVLSLLIACKEVPPSAPDTSILGSYELLAVDGLPPPVTFYADGETWELVGGTFVLNADERYTLSITSRFFSDGGPETHTELSQGSYTVSKGVIQLVNASGTLVTGTISMDFLTIASTEGVFVFGR